MTRKKVKLAYITNDSARKATFKKRKKGLLKKVHELSTLCGIEACAIIYGPNDTQPEVWPSPLGVQRVLAKFDRMPEMEQNKKMMNQESFLKQRLEKLSEQLKKQLRDNREKEITRVMFQSLTGRGLDGLNLVDLNDLGWVTEQYKKEIQQKLDRLNNVPLNYNPMPLSVVPAEEAQEVGEIMPTQLVPCYDVNMDQQRPSWFMDMMNPQEPIGFAGEEPMLPFGDNGFAPLWPNGPFA